MTVSEFINRVGFEVDEQSVQNVNNTISSLKSAATKLLGALGIGLSLRSLNAIAEEFNQINDRINAVVGEEQDAKEVQQDILKAANECKMSYGSMAKDVASLVNSNKELFPIEDATEFTKIVQEIGKVAGYSDGEISSMMSSLQRMIASGAASTTDITRMLRSTPALAQQLADSLEVDVSELSEMASQGQLTADVIKESILGSADAVDLKFRDLNYSISDALLNVRNQWGYFVDEVNSTLQISQTVAKVIAQGFTAAMNALNNVKNVVFDLNDALGGGNNLFRLLAIAAGAFVAIMAWSQIIKGAGLFHQALTLIHRMLGLINVRTLALVGAVVAVALVIDDFINFMQGNDSMIGYCFEQAGIDCEEMRQKIVNIWDNLVTFFSGIWESIKGVFDSALSWIGQKLIDIFGDDSIFAGLGEGLAGVIEFIERLTGVLAENKDLQDTIGKLAVAFVGLFAATKVLGGVTGTVSKFGGALSGIRNALGGGKGGGEAAAGAAGSRTLAGSITGFFQGFANIKTGTLLKGLANAGIVFGAVTALAALVMAIAPYMAQLSDASSLLEVLVTITAVGLIASGLAELAGLVGNIPIMQVVQGVGNMAIAIVAMGALAAAVMAIAGPLSSLSSGGEIAELLLVITGVGAIGGVLAALAGVIGLIPFPVVIQGLADIALAIGGFTAIAAAFGELSKIPGFSELVGGGMEALSSIANGLGDMLGSLIGGIGEGISDSLPAIGENIGAFGTNITPFFDAINGVDTSGVASFIEAVSGFVLTMMGNDIVSFFTGGPDLAEIGTQLSDFADSASGFFEAIQEIPEESFAKATALFTALNGMGDVMKTGGISGLIEGNTDFDKVSAALASMAGEGVSAFFTMVQGLPEDTFSKATALFDSLKGMGDVMKTGGLSGFISGNANYDKVSDALSQLTGEGVKGFFAMVADLPSNTFSKASDLIQSLKDISDVLSAGGLAGLMTASGDFSNISTTLQQFVNGGIIDFYNTVGEIPTSSFSAATDMMQSLSELGNIMSNGGVEGLLGGSTDFSALVDFADNVKYFFDTAGTIDSGTLDAIISRLQGFCDEVRNAVEDRFADVADNFAGIGQQIMDGLARGIQNGTSTVVSAITSAVNQAVQAGKDAAGVASPSKRMRDELGVQMPEGAAVGIRKNTSSAVDAMRDMVNSLLGQGDTFRDRLQNAFGGIEIMAGANMVSPATAMTNIGGSTDNSRNISQNVNINNTFNGDRAIQKETSRAMNDSAEDITEILARGFAYAR